MKKVMGKIWDEFIYGGHLTALGAPAIALTVANLNRSEISWSFLIVLYLLVEIIYLIDHLKDNQSDKSTNLERSSFIRSKSWLWPISYFVIFIFLSLSYGNLNFILVLLIYLIFGATYPLYTKSLSKKITGFKNYIVIALWSTIPVLYYTFYSIPLNNLLFYFVFFMIIREFVNTSYCDIKDIKSDQLRGLKTLPVKLGKTKTLNILSVVNLTAIVPIIYGIYQGTFPRNSVVLIGAIVYCFIYINIAKSADVKQRSFLFSLTPDIEPIIYFALVTLGSYNGF